MEISGNYGQIHLKTRYVSCNKMKVGGIFGIFAGIFNCSMHNSWNLWGFLSILTQNRTVACTTMGNMCYLKTVAWAKAV